MIVTKDFPNKQFANKDELFAELRANKHKLKTAKTLSIKEADAFYYVPSTTNNKETNKANASENDVKKISVKFVVNSCGWYDSHGDVHVKGCWNKTANENKRFLHLQEHVNKFDHVISDNVIPSVEEIEIKGKKVDALVATSTIERKDNPFMFDKYVNGKVKEHSVGMQYIWDKLYLAIDSNHDDDKEEKANWDKYITQVINQDEVNEKGYFWAVAEAKAIEGSAVVMGSNSQTPTMQVTEIKEVEPSNHSNEDKEPSNDTLIKAINNLKI